MSKQIKELILENTFLLLLEKGYERISVSDIQKSMGISRGLLYRYFQNKDDLVLQTCRNYFVDRFMVSDEELGRLTFKEFLAHMHKCMVALLEELEQKHGQPISLAKYNILYADIVMRCEGLKNVVFTEFPKVIVVVEKAKADGELNPEFSSGFILNVALDILTRVTSAEPDESAARARILSDLNEFYSAVRRTPATDKRRERSEAVRKALGHK